MIVFSCDGLNCSAQIRIEPDNDKNFKCPKCKRKYDADEGKDIYFNEELDLFLRENLEKDDYLRLQGDLEDDTYFYKSEESIIARHISNSKKKVSKEEFDKSFDDFKNKINELVYKVPEPPKPLDLIGIREKMEESILTKGFYLAHEILIYEAMYYDYLENNSGKNPNSIAHGMRNEDNEKNKNEIEMLISSLKEFYPEINLEEHRKKFKAVRSGGYSASVSSGHSAFEIKNVGNDQTRT